MNWRGAVILAAVVVFASAARGQAFIGPGVSAFSPQIGVVDTGVLNDVQATVSPDRRYVALTMRPQQSTLLSLQQFQFQVGAASTGFVGGVTFDVPGATETGAFGSVNAPMLLERGRGAALLRQRGMTRVVLQP